jgi:uncharacterized protein (TIGR03437 family)
MRLMFRVFAVFSLLVSATCALYAQTTRYAYTPILINSVFSNWNGAGKQARDVFLPAKMIAAATDGSVYTLMTGNGRVVRIAPSGLVAEVFRIGGTAFGPGVPALGVLLNANTIAVSPDGLLYFADQTRHRIFRIEADGTVSLVAGSGTRGFSGDAGQAASAQLSTPLYMAAGTDKTLYFFDSGNSRIRSVDSFGTIRTVAGNGQTGEPSTGTQALSTPMTSVIDLAVDGAGNLYVLRSGSGFNGTTLWKIEKATSTVRLWAGGNANWVAITNGMQATGAQLRNLKSVAVESDGTAYMAWQQGGVSSVGYFNQVLRVTPAGLLNVVAGAGPIGYSGDGGAALQAQLAQPKSITTDRQGSIYLLDHLMVRKIDSKGVITTTGGAPSGPAMGEDGPVSAAQLMNYTTVKTGPDGMLYFAEYFTSTVWKIDATGTLRRVAGNGISGFGGDGGPARNAMLDWPEALCFDPQGNLFIFDNGNDRIRKVTPGGTISTVVGGATTNVKTDPTDPVPGTQIGISSPWGCTVDPQGNLLYTDFTWFGVYRLDSAGMVKRIVGVGGSSSDSGGDGGAATAAKLSSPRGLAYDSKGNLYIAEYGAHRIRKVSTTGTISTFAGTGIAGFSGDGGPATSAQLNGPFEFTIDAQDNIFVFELTGGRIRRITPEGVISTVAGGGTLVAQSGVEATSVSLQPSFWIGLSKGAGGVLNVTDNIALATLEPAQIFSNWVAHGASFAAGAISPGQVVTYWGVDMGPKQMALASYDASGKLATSVAGTKVYFDGVEAPLVYVSDSQSSAIVPYGVSGTTKMQVEYNGRRTNTIPLSVVPTRPGIFTYSAGTGQGVIVNTDSSFNGASNAVERGGWIVFFVSGQGVTNPQIADGQLPVSPNFPAPAAPVRVFFGDVEAPAADIWAGLIYQGVLQVNVKVPANVTPGTAVQLKMRIGSLDSQAGVTVAVK